MLFVAADYLPFIPFFIIPAGKVCLVRRNNILNRGAAVPLADILVEAGSNVQEKSRMMIRNPLIHHIVAIVAGDNTGGVRSKFFMDKINNLLPLHPRPQRHIL